MTSLGSRSSDPAPRARRRGAERPRSPAPSRRPLRAALGATPSSAAPAALLVTALLAAAGDARAEEVPVFTTPPSADELADILFPPRTRSIVIDADVPSAYTGGDRAQGRPASAVSEAAATASGAATGAGAGAPANAPASAFGLLVNFEYGKADITAASRPYLDSVGEMLRLERAADSALLIEGHTDAVGSDAFNQDLSERRALAVQRYLVSVHRVDPIRLRTVGRGESELHRPAEPTAAINRRVEFRLLDEARDGV